MKRSRVLDEELRAEAEVPYEQTRLARQATRARPRLAGLLLVGLAGFALEAALARHAGWALGAVALAVVAWGVWRARLAGVIGAGFVALLALLIPLALIAMGDQPVGDRVLLAFVAAWAATLLPDVLTLVRDAELQYAYGRWARR